MLSEKCLEHGCRAPAIPSGLRCNFHSDKTGSLRPLVPTWTESAYVYAIEALGVNRPVKFGYSKDPRKRLDGLNLASAEPLRLVGWIRGDRKLERLIHVALMADQYHGEWFFPSDAVVAVRGFFAESNSDGLALWLGLHAK